MSLKTKINLDDFTLKGCKISDKGVDATFEEKRLIDGVNKTINHNISADYQPHPDLLGYRDSLKDYLILAYGFNSVFDEATKYLKGEQKQKIEEKMIDISERIEVTGISISGQDQLRGVVISGKIKSFNNSKCAINTPRIVYSSDKIGIEVDVEGQIEMIEREVFKYLYENKKAQTDLFDEAESKEVKGIDVKDAEEVSTGLVS